MRWSDTANYLDTYIWADADVYYTTQPATAGISKALTTNQIVSAVTISKIKRAGTFTADSTLNGIIPAGTYLDKIIITESSGNTGQISGGVTASGVELFSSVGIAGSDSTVANVAKYFSTATPIYLHHYGDGDDWNGMRLNLIIIYWKI